VVEIVKKAFDVEIEHPVIAPASLARLTDCIEGRLPRSVPVRIGVKMLLHLRFEIPLHHHLGYPVCHRRNPERPCPAIALWYVDPSHRRREVTP
jgi:hypothetical protein